MASRARDKGLSRALGTVRKRLSFRAFETDRCLVDLGCVFEARGFGGSEGQLERLANGLLFGRVARRACSTTP